MRRRVIIMGAGGRDFHNFNTVYRNDPDVEVVAFTATQIPFIAGRLYPPHLAGPHYPEGIPIYPEEDIETLITRLNAGQVLFAYSDISHEELMHVASRCLSLGPDFMLPGPERTMLRSTVPVISVCAVRTGCGKSIIARTFAALLKEKGIGVSVVRHPMAYCAFVPVSRFSSLGDIDRESCTIEEREEFEHLVQRGLTVYAGVDYERVVREAERDVQAIIWDGGNNDFPFIKPDLEIVLLDALRPGHETLFYPGEVNLRRADILIITKVNEARREDIERIRRSISKENSAAQVLEAPSVLTLSDRHLAEGKRALVIEDGPTITHGGMPYGAGVAASRNLVSHFVDPRPYAVGSIQEAYAKFPHIGPVLPAMGYSEGQINDLEQTILRVPADVVIIATPIDLRRIVKIGKPNVRVFYDFDVDLKGVVDSFIKTHGF